jgi:putative OPT family oligopeptide transporter
MIKPISPGEVGSSSNPISGMTVATLLLTCLVFLVLGWTGPSYYVTALSVGAIVCIASSNGGTTSQDLKTGFLVGATPRNQQIAIVIGALLSAVLLGPVLVQLNEAATSRAAAFGRTRSGSAPQASALEQVRASVTTSAASNARRAWPASARTYW